MPYRSSLLGNSIFKSFRNWKFFFLRPHKLPQVGNWLPWGIIWVWLWSSQVKYNSDVLDNYKTSGEKKKLRRFALGERLLIKTYTDSKKWKKKKMGNFGIWSPNSLWTGSWMRWRHSCQHGICFFMEKQQWLKFMKKWKVKVSDSLQPHERYPIMLLCPWNFPGKNTEMGCHFLLQGILPTQGSNLDVLHYRQIINLLNYQEGPWRVDPNTTETFSRN